MGKLFISEVPGHEGDCLPTWLNPWGCRFMGRIDGGVTGFFKKAVKRRYLPGYKKTGAEFHGLIRFGTGVVISTEWDNDDDEC